MLFLISTMHVIYKFLEMGLLPTPRSTHNNQAKFGTLIVVRHLQPAPWLVTRSVFRRCPAKVALDVWLLYRTATGGV